MHLPENWLSFILAILIPMIVGSLWYGPLFGRIWMNMMNLTEERIKETLNPVKSYGGSFIGSIFTAYVLSLLINYTGFNTLSGGILIGFVVWIGFALPMGWQNVAWEDKGLGLYVLNQAYNLLVFLLMGGLIGGWH